MFRTGPQLLVDSGLGRLQTLIYTGVAVIILKISDSIVTVFRFV